MTRGQSLRLVAIFLVSVRRAVGDAVEPAGEALHDAFGLHAAADNEDGATDAVDDFAGDVAQGVGAEVAAAQGGAGHDQIVIAGVEFLEDFVNDSALAHFHLGGDAEGLEGLFLFAEIAAEFGFGIEDGGNIHLEAVKTGIDGGRFGHDVKEGDGGLHAVGDLAGEGDCVLDVPPAARCR